MSMPDVASSIAISEKFGQMEQDINKVGALFLLISLRVATEVPKSHIRSAISEED